MDNVVDENIKFKPTVGWMKENYDKANSELFGNELGDCSFSVESLVSNRLGEFSFRNKCWVDTYSRRMYQKSSFYYNSSDKVWINKGNFVERCAPIIKLNSHYSGTYDSWYNTLVHEMCHYYTYMYGYCPKQGHGPEFRRIADYVCYKSGGKITITRLASSEKMLGYELDDDLKQKRLERKEKKKLSATYYVVFTKGKTRLVNTKSEQAVKEMIDYEERRGSTIVKITDPEITEEFFNRGFTTQFRVYRYWELSPNDKTIEKLLLTNNAIEKILNENMKSNSDAEITPGMDLGQRSPIEEVQLQEKSVSKSQQRFMGMVDAYKKGDLSDDDVSQAIKDAAKSMTMKQVKDFAKTKHKGLPNHVKKHTIKESVLKHMINENIKKLYEVWEDNLTWADEEPKDDWGRIRKSRYDNLVETIEYYSNLDSEGTSLSQEQVEQLTDVAEKISTFGEIGEKWAETAREILNKHRQEDFDEELNEKEDWRSIGDRWAETNLNVNHGKPGGPDEKLLKSEYKLYKRFKKRFEEEFGANTFEKAREVAMRFDEVGINPSNPIFKYFTSDATKAYSDWNTGRKFDEELNESVSDKKLRQVVRESLQDILKGSVQKLISEMVSDEEEEQSYAAYEKEIKSGKLKSITTKDGKHFSITSNTQEIINQIQEDIEGSKVYSYMYENDYAVFEALLIEFDNPLTWQDNSKLKSALNNQGYQIYGDGNKEKTFVKERYNKRRY